MNTIPLKLMILHFWRGGYALGWSFWLFGIVGSLMVTSLNAVLVSMGDELSLIMVFGMAAVSVSYQVWVSVGIWRSAASYAGPKLHAQAARAFVIFYAIYGAVTMTFMLIILMLGSAVMLNPPFIK